jgi:hypothetical protein
MEASNGTVHERRIDVFDASFAYLPGYDGAVTPEQWVPYWQRFRKYIEELNGKVARWVAQRPEALGEPPYIYIANAEMRTPKPGTTPSPLPEIVGETSEFLAASDMVGGLTRWEMLGLIKAGFKNAFLKHEEIDGLLRHVEDRIYAHLLDGYFAAYER